MSTTFKELAQCLSNRALADRIDRVAGGADDAGSPEGEAWLREAARRLREARR